MPLLCTRCQTSQPSLADEPAEEAGCPEEGQGSWKGRRVGKGGGGRGAWGLGRAWSVQRRRQRGGARRDEMVGDEAERGLIVSSFTHIYCMPTAYHALC